MTDAQSSRPTGKKSPPAMTAWHVRFDSDSASNLTALRNFADPLPARATATMLEWADLPSAINAANSTTGIYAAFLPGGKSSMASVSDWLDMPRPNLPPPAVVRLESGQISWWPGRAIISGNVGQPEAVLAAIAEFAFHEAQLRTLEQELAPIEQGSVAELQNLYESRPPAHRQARYATMCRQLAGLRLRAARLEPRTYCPPRDMPLPSRKIAARLAARADLEDRLEAFSARLEACEDLYEGALNRITDNTWARKGNRLEVAIVALLAVEVILLLLELAARYGWRIR